MTTNSGTLMNCTNKDKSAAEVITYGSVLQAKTYSVIFVQSVKAVEPRGIRSIYGDGVGLVKYSG